MELDTAVNFGSLGDVASALSHGANPNALNHLGFSPLRLAANAGDVEKVKLLIQSGADVRARDADGNSALCQAIVNGREDLIRLLLDRGAEVSGRCDCGSPIAAAVLSNNVRLIKLLVSVGADVNRFNDDGFTPLMLAAGNGVPNAIPELIAAGAQLHLRDSNGGLTAFLHAAFAGDMIAGRILISAGANPDDRDDDGEDAVALALKNGHEWSL